MSDEDAYQRILASLSDAMLDDSHWPATSALIDEACGLTSNALMIGEGPKDDIRVLTPGFYRRGQRHEEQEREYLQIYHPIDERVPRVRRLPDSRLVHVTDLYTAEELRTSPTYNEFLLRTTHQNSLNVRLEASDGSYITWGLGDPVASDGWGSSQIAMIETLLPHIRQFIRVRQTLVRAEARDTSVTALLDNPRIGVLHLDRRGRILEINDRARSILRQGRWIVGPGWGAVCTKGRRPAPPREAGGLGAAGRREPLRPAGRCWWAAGPVHRRWWCTSNPSLFRNRTTERGIPPRWY